MDSIIGIDEAGRGPLAGPVVAAAVILDTKKPIDGLHDSKKLSAKRREALYEQIRVSAIDVGIGICSAAEVDEFNIFQATMKAMQRAVAQLRYPAKVALIDGKHAPQLPLATQAIVGGDATEPAIMAASIIAKVTRDQIMTELAGSFPGYGFEQHKGYGTKQHMQALQELGPCPEHRRSFAPVKQALLTAGEIV